MISFRKFYTNLINIQSSDPEDARKRKLLTILLIGVALLPLPLIPVSLFFSGTIGLSQSEAISITAIAVIVFIVSGILYTINRYVSGKLASTLFLLFLAVIFIFADTPIELSNGRSLILFTIPIVFSSLLLGPASSFIFALISSIEIALLALSIEIIPNIPAMVTLFALALVSWLSSRSLEVALKDLRNINTNLDNIVTERTHALAEALTRERIEAGRNQAILESIADGVIVFNTQGSAIQANPALSTLINVPLNNIVNATVNDLIEASPMDAKNKGTLAGLLIKPGATPVNYRVEWGQKTISVSSGQVLDNDGSEIGTVAVFRDFTKEADLEKMKSAFVAMVSHELRTPLSAILGYAEIFKEQVYGPLNEKQVSTTERIITNSRRLLSLINDLLDQAQMEAGKLKIKNGTIVPSNLLENLHSVMDKLTEDKGLKLTSKLDENLQSKIVGDSARLQQILVNLVNNAVKFTEEGTIHVQLSKVDKTHWGMTVTDTGQGIPKEDLPYIFETFRQVEGATTRVHGGFGLGLAIVKQLVTLMSGTISVSSELGQGSVFSITLPIDIISK